MTIETERADGIAADQASDPTSVPAGAAGDQSATSPSDDAAPAGEGTASSAGTGSDASGEGTHAPRRAGPRRAGPRRAGPTPKSGDDDGAKAPVIPPKKRPVPRTKPGRTASTARPAGSAVPAVTGGDAGDRDPDTASRGDREPGEGGSAEKSLAGQNPAELNQSDMGHADSEHGDDGGRDAGAGRGEAREVPTPAPKGAKSARPAGTPRRRTVKGRATPAPLVDDASLAEADSGERPPPDVRDGTSGDHGVERVGPSVARVSVRSEMASAPTGDEPPVSVEAVPDSTGHDGAGDASPAGEVTHEETPNRPVGEGDGDHHQGAADQSASPGPVADTGAEDRADAVGAEDFDAVSVASARQDDLGPIRPDFVRMVVDGVPIADGGPTTRVVPALSAEAGPRRAGGRPKTVEENLIASNGAPVPVGGDAGPVVVPVSPPNAAAAASSAQARPGGARRVKVQLAQISPWSVMKLGFLLSVGLGIAFVVAVYVVWNVLDRIHLFVEINEQIAEIVGPESAANFDLLQYVELGKVMAAATGIAVINVVLATILATLGSLLYNVTSALVGGIHVTLRDD